MNREKYAQAILYFATECDNHHLGKVKMMKLLYYLDFDHYERYESSVTGDVYRKLPLGPVPDKAEYMLAIMAAEKHLEQKKVSVGPYVQHRVVPLEPFNLGVFSPSERETLELVRDRWKSTSTKEIVEQTHCEAPWLAVEMYDEIPYQYALYRNTFGDEEEEDDTETGYLSPDAIEASVG